MQKAISKLMAGVLIVAFIVVGVAGYFSGSLTTTPETVTKTSQTTIVSTSTTSIGGTGVITQTSTITNTQTVIPPALQTQYDNMQIEQALIEGAKKEGKLMLYTSMDVGMQEVIINKFREKYPFIQVEYFQGVSAPMYSRIKAEVVADKWIADVVWTNDFGAKRGMGVQNDFAFQPYLATAQYDFKNDQLLLPGLDENYFTPAVLDRMAIAVNTKLLPIDKAPKTWQDILKPEYKGEVGGCITLIRASYGEFNQMIGATKEWKYPLPGDAAYKYLQAMKGQISTWRNAGADCSQSLALGEYSILFTILREDIMAQYALGSPVAYITPPGELIMVRGAYLMKKPPHPNAAKLYINWLASPEGQVALYRIEQQPALKPYREFIGLRDDAVIAQEYSYLHRTNATQAVHEIFGV